MERLPLLPIERHPGNVAGALRDSACRRGYALRHCVRRSIQNRSRRGVYEVGWEEEAPAGRQQVPDSRKYEGGSTGTRKIVIRTEPEVTETEPFPTTRIQEHMSW